MQRGPEVFLLSQYTLVACFLQIMLPLISQTHYFDRDHITGIRLPKFSGFPTQSTKVDSRIYEEIVHSLTPTIVIMYDPIKI